MRTKKTKATRKTDQFSQYWTSIPHKQQVFYIIIAIFFIIITISIPIFTNLNLSQKQIDKKFEEIEKQINKTDSADPIDINFLKDSYNFIKNNSKEINSDQKSFVEANINLQLATFYTENEDYEKSCDYANNYLEITENESNQEAKLLSNPKVAVRYAIGLYILGNKCEKIELGQILDLTEFTEHKTKTKIALVYYDNIVSKSNAIWLADTFGEDKDNIILDDKNFRDAIRIIILDEEDLELIDYKQFRSETREDNYFQYQFQTFYLQNNKLYWTHNNKEAVDLNK